MNTIGVRELQQHASAALRRVERGETIGVTDRGRLVAVLSAPSSATGAGALVASGRVTPARRGSRELPEPVTATANTLDVLEEPGLTAEPVVWYLDTSAFLKLLVVEEESTALRSWYASSGSVWSSHLLRTEALRAAVRLGIETNVVEDALDTVSLVLPGVTTFATAGRRRPEELRSLDALHLAAALEIGEDLEGMVAYDGRLIRAAAAADIRVISPA